MNPVGHFGNRVFLFSVALLFFSGFCSANQLPVGYFDLATCVRFTGWACDADNYSQPLTVKFYLDGEAGKGGLLIGSVAANVAREQAVANSCGGKAGHGFILALPDSLKDGKQHTIYAYAINTPAGTNPLLTNTKTIKCNCPNNICVSDTLTAGDYKVSVDWVRGGAVNTFSYKGLNFIDNASTGLMLQAAVFGPYSKDEPDDPSAMWNPTQAGDANENPSPVLEKSNNGSEIYSKTQMLQWYPALFIAGSTNPYPSNVTLEQWITLRSVNGQGVLKTRYKVTSNEPRTYVAANGKTYSLVDENGSWKAFLHGLGGASVKFNGAGSYRMFTYGNWVKDQQYAGQPAGTGGDQPWTNAPYAQIPIVKNAWGLSGAPFLSFIATEKWVHVSKPDSMFGITSYNNEDYPLAGNYPHNRWHAHWDSTWNSIGAVPNCFTVLAGEGGSIENTFYYIIGDLNATRPIVYQLAGRSTSTSSSTTSSTTSMTTTTLSHAEGDADGDGQVNYKDLTILAASYGRAQGQAGFDGRADFNGDGVVDYDDLILLASYYEKN